MAVLVIALVLRLRQGRRRLLDHICTGPEAERRKARERAALAQLRSIRRGDTDIPPLKELEEVFVHEFADGNSASEKHLCNRVRNSVEHRKPHKTDKTGKPEGAANEDISEEEPQETPDVPVASGPATSGMTRSAVLLSLAGGEKNLGDLLAHIRAFSGTAFAPGPTELGECLRDLGRDGLIRQTGGEPPFACYIVTPAGGRELHRRTPLEPDGRVVAGS